MDTHIVILTISNIVKNS